MKILRKYLRFDSVSSNSAQLPETIPPVGWMNTEVVHSSTDHTEWFPVQGESVGVSRNETGLAPSCRIVVVPCH